jgi:hypothetical protein
LIIFFHNYILIKTCFLLEGSIGKSILYVNEN